MTASDIFWRTLLLAALVGAAIWPGVWVGRRLPQPHPWWARPYWWALLGYVLLALSEALSPALSELCLATGVVLWMSFLSWVWYRLGRFLWRGIRGTFWGQALFGMNPLNKEPRP